MNSARSIPGGWTRRRFWSVTCILFAAQAGLIMLFGGGGRLGAGASLTPSHIHLLEEPVTADQLSKIFFASDPAVFPELSAHGFSGTAWLNAPEQQAEVSGRTEDPAWLALKPAQLGTNFPSLNRVKSPAASDDLADKQGAAPEPWPVFLTPETFRTNSAFELRGQLAARQLNAPGELRSWPSAQVLSNTIVQIAVNSAGQVVSARLRERSGLADADTNALAEARQLRFRPSPSPAPVWGEAVFEWQTAEPAGSVSIGTP